MSWRSCTWRRPCSAVAAGLIVALAIAIVGRVPTASAHAIIVESSPAVNQEVGGPDLRIRLRFNSRIDRKRSRLTLTLPDKSSQPVPILDGDEANILPATVSGLAAGAYSLHWQVLSVDGHITRGDIPFRIAVP